MLRKSPPVDPILLREQSLRISSSVSLPIGWISTLRRYADERGVKYSTVIMEALEAYGEKQKLGLIKVKY